MRCLAAVIRKRWERDKKGMEKENKRKENGIEKQKKRERNNVT